VVCAVLLSSRYSKPLRRFLARSCPCSCSLTSLLAVGKFHKTKIRVRSRTDDDSTGGTIALGLSVKNWSVEECIKRFKELSSDAYSPRELTGVPIVENLAVFYHGSIYKTRPFERGLKMMFQEQPLFGGTNCQRETPTKVAVLGTTSLEQRSVVFANYNRQDLSDESESPRCMATGSWAHKHCQVSLTSSCVPACRAMT
jgi:hypothetical protein